MLPKKEVAELDTQTAKEIFNFSLEGIIIAIGTFPRIVFANKAFERTFGYTEKELRKFSALQILNLVYPKDRKLFFNRYRQRISGHTVPSHYEFRGIHKNGKIRWIELFSHRIKYKGSYAIQANFLDVTQQHEILDIQTSISQERKEILENISESIIILDKNSRVFEINKAFEKLSSLKRKEIINHSVFELFVRHIVPSYRMKVLTLTKKILRGETIRNEEVVVDYRNKKKILYFSVAFVKSYVKNVKYIICTIRDVTDERLYIANLNKVLKDNLNLTKKYQIATDFSGQVFYEYEIKTGKIVWFGPVRQVLGYSSKQFQEVNIEKWTKLIHPDDRDQAVKILDAAQKAVRKYTCEYRFRKMGGDYLPMYDEGSFFRDKQTNEVRMIGSMRDISKLKKAQEELINKEKIFRKVITSIPVITFMINKRGIVTFAEGEGLLKFGLKSGESIGQSIYELCKDYPAVINSVSKTLKGKQEVCEVNVGEICYKVSFSPSYDKKKSVDGIIGVATDISDRKAAEKNIESDKAKDEALLKAIPDGVIAVDCHKKIIFINESAKKLLGLPISRNNGKFTSEILNLTFGSNKEKVEEFYLPYNSYKEGVVKDIKDNVYCTNLQGKSFPVYTSLTPIYIENKVFGVIYIFRDITIEKEVDRMKSEFVSLSSHQLRTPVTSIKWLTEVLLEDKKDKLLPKHRDIIECIRNDNNRMIGLINAFLNVSRLEIGTFIVNPRNMKIEDICGISLQQLSGQIKSKKLSVKTACPKGMKYYKADPSLMTIIFQNLLSNAVKYSHEDSTININGKYDKNYFIIAVSDKGIGIPEKQQAEIFKKFFRADNARIIDTEGTGLGLYIVKLIIDAVGGRIWFKSRENAGSTFFVALPREGMKKREGTKSLV